MARILSPADLTYEDLNRINTNNEAGTLNRVADAARNFVCDIYKEHPDGIIPQFGDPTGFNGLRHSLMDKLCRPLGKLPVTPPNPFVGGQCKGNLYEVRVNTQDIVVRNDGFKNEQNQSSNAFYGPIRGVYAAGALFLRYQGTTLKVYRYIYVEAFDKKPDGTYVPITFKLRENFPADNRGVASISTPQVTPIDGRPDVCGNPAPRYPNTNPQAPVFSNTVNITNNVNVNVAVPITLIPTLIAPIGISIRPEVNVNVGGINVKFDLGGATFSQPKGIEPGTDVQDDPREVPPDPIVIEPEPSGSTSVDLQPVIDRLKEIKDELDECCDRNHPFEDLPTDRYDVRLLGEAQSGSFNLPGKCYRVVTQILNPGIWKDVYQADNSPDVYFAGWAWFASGGGQLVRQPIDALIKAFDVPPRSDAKFSFQTRRGYVVKVFAYYSKK